MTEKIGVYLCECSGNISGALDFDRLNQIADDQEDVALVRRGALFCAGDDLASLSADIRENDLSRVVVACCPPSEHESTFGGALEEAGLNRYLMRIVDIREGAAWVIEDRDKATAKAGSMIEAAIRRVREQKPLEAPVIDASPDVLVVGAGIAGVEAALSIAENDRRVILVERQPCIGGRIAMLGETFPDLECASCMMEPKLDDVLHNENITLMVNSEVSEVVGFLGNYEVTIKKKAARVEADACYGCPTCVEACPVEVDNEFDCGLSKRKAIYIPYVGALPNLATIDEKNCLALNGKECTACVENCGFGAINFEAEDEVIVEKVGAMVLATGGDVYSNLADFGYGSIDAVYTSFEVQRLLNSAGPTGGELIGRNGEAPSKIAIVHCAGSLNMKHRDYCSGFCCLDAMKVSRLISEQNPDAEIVHYYHDLVAPGKDEHKMLTEARERGAKFIHLARPGAVAVSAKGDAATINPELESGEGKKFAADMVILSVGMIPSAGSGELASMIEADLDDEGFIKSADSHLAPMASSRKGVYIAGACQGPKDIAGSISQGAAAAGKILKQIKPGEQITLDAVYAVVDEDKCSGCRMCISLCPYKAIKFDAEKGVSVISEVLCEGCGTCGAGCPSGAIVSRNYDPEAIYAEIKGIVHERY